MQRSEKSAPNADILIGWCIGERYELETLVGRGSKSLVFRARDLESDRSVGIKLLFDANYSDRETSAALAASQIEHPGIGRVTEAGRADDDIPYLVVELIDGHTVAELLLGRDQIISIVVAAARAVGAAHVAGVVHGNIKASNVFVTANGDVKVIDFGRRGSAHVRASRAGSARLRAMLNVVAEWNAEHSAVMRQPEGPGAVAIDPREDVKALALLLLDLLAPDATASVGARIDGLALVPSLAPIGELIRRASSTATEQRPASAAKFAEELMLAAESGVEPARSERILPCAPAETDSLLGRVLGQRYRLDEVIGRGTTSTVYRARHLELGSWIAIKVLSPAPSILDNAVQDRFRFEAQVLAGLRHPGIVSVLDLGTTEDGLCYIAMELLQGETLAALIERRRRLETPRAMRLLSQIADALAVLHDRGLVHRDVKPANVFVVEDSTRQERAKLMDFGLVRAQDGRESDGDAGGRAVWETFPRRRQNTQRGVILGTGAYMSPELIQAGRLDARSDVYALGVVAYRLLTGCLPFKAETLGQLLTLHVNAPVEPLRQRAPDAGIPAEVERVIMRALAKSPGGRPASARQFAQELLAAADSQSIRSATAPLATASIGPGVRGVQSVTLRMDVRAAKSLAAVAGDPYPSAAEASPKAEVDSVGAVSVLCAESDAGSDPRAEPATHRAPSVAHGDRSRRQRLSRMSALAVLVGASVLGSYAMLAGRGSEATRAGAKVSGFAGEPQPRAAPAARPAVPPAVPPVTASAPVASSYAAPASLPRQPSSPTSADRDRRQRKSTGGKRKRSSAESADELKIPAWR
jgi:eukaryotic-like serine/threonine-protein kinase